MITNGVPATVLFLLITDMVFFLVAVDTGSYYLIKRSHIAIQIKAVKTCAVANPPPYRGGPFCIFFKLTTDTCASAVTARRTV